jgi:hypothetical protein
MARYVTLKDSNGEALYPQIKSDSIADGSVTSDKIDYAIYGIGVTRQIGIDSDSSKVVYRTILGSDNLSIPASTWTSVGNVFGSGSGTVETVYKIDCVVRNTAATRFCSGFWNNSEGAIGGLTEPIGSRVKSDGTVEIIVIDDSFSGAKVRVVVEYTKA